MDRLPHDPKNLRELVEADLRRAARLVIKVQDEIDPQFRLATPEGDYWIAVTLPREPYGRKVILRNLSLFMAWKQAIGFTLASELIEPDAVYCVGITLKECAACLARIRREPWPWSAANFGTVEWMPESSIDPALTGMQPKGAREITAQDLATLDKWFGAKGKRAGEGIGASFIWRSDHTCHGSRPQRPGGAGAESAASPLPCCRRAFIRRRPTSFEAIKCRNKIYREFF